MLYARLPTLRVPVADQKTSHPTAFFKRASESYHRLFGEKAVVIYKSEE